MTLRQKRKRMFSLRLSAEEGERFFQLADHYGIDVASMVRMLVKREYDFKINRQPVGAISELPQGNPAQAYQGQEKPT